MTTSDQSAFIRKAVQLADLNALKVALFQNTNDEALTRLPTADAMSTAQRTWLSEKAVAWLEANGGTGELPEPTPSNLRRMMNMITGGEMGELEFEARRDLTGFKSYPYMAQWSNGKPKLPPHFSIAIIGSGFAGIGAGVQLDQLGIPYTVYERRPEPGGVWSINRYPDVRVDTISVTYEFLFERDHDWDEYFGRGPQVRDYLRKVAIKRGVFDNTRFNHDLTNATWNDERKVWILQFSTPEGSVTYEANAILSCAGLFATPKSIDWKGSESFEGRIVHTAEWSDDIDLSGKKVATIGNGSTGIQMLGAIAKEASHVSVFQRTPQWIMPRDKYGLPVEPEVRWLVRNLPGYWNWWRYSATSNLFEMHDLMKVDPEWQAKGGLVSAANDAIREQLTAYIKKETGDREDLVERVVPDYAPFSRRPIVDNGWYRALTRDNVELVTSSIERLVAKGIETADGTIHEVDVIVTATGYDVVKYLLPARYTGRGGIDLHDRWDAGDGPRAYLGLMHPDFPNLWTIYGPNSQPLSGGPAQPVWFAIWVAYACQCLIHIIEGGHLSAEVKTEAYDRYNAELDDESMKLLQMKEEGGVSKNYYVNNQHNRLQVNAPWYSPYFYRLCSDIEFSDLDFR